MGGWIPGWVPGWVWWKIWKWPEYFMQWRKQWHELKEAKAKRQKAEIERDAAKVGEISASLKLEADEEQRQIDQYLEQMEELDHKTPGGLRSQPKAEEGENQKLVNKAWELFVAKRTRGKGRDDRLYR